MTKLPNSEQSYNGKVKTHKYINNQNESINGKFTMGKLKSSELVVLIRISVRGLLLTRKLLNQGFLLVKLKSSLRKFYYRHHDLVDRCGISVSQMTTDMLTQWPKEKGQTTIYMTYI
jgi:uncharacterized protein YbcC (UPF0753/DUF2309 family)